MDIIVLTGKSSSGKTSSLKYLMMKILDMNGITVLYSSRFFSNDPKKLKENIVNKWYTSKGNISDLSILVQYNGKIVCITSYGDSINDVKSALDRAIGSFGKCDLFICGRHMCNDPEMEFSEYHPENIVSIEKARSLVKTDYYKDNVCKSDELYKSIKEALTCSS